MGENEHGGMLRTVVVIGIIAMIAIVITVGVVRLNANVNKNTHRALVVVATTTVPYGLKDKGDATFGSYTPLPNKWNGNWYRLPQIGELPPNSWREIHVKLTANSQLNLTPDINNYYGPGYTVSNNKGNDNDVIAKRYFKVYENGQNIPAGLSANLKAGHTYDCVIKYFNGNQHTLYEGKTDNTRCALVFNSKDGSPVSATIISVEAATYDDEYAK